MTMTWVVVYKDHEYSTLRKVTSPTREGAAEQIIKGHEEFITIVDVFHCREDD
jgi:hypothetical protein